MLIGLFRFVSLIWCSLWCSIAGCSHCTTQVQIQTHAVLRAATAPSRRLPRPKCNFWWVTGHLGWKFSDSICCFYVKNCIVVHITDKIIPVTGPLRIPITPIPCPPPTQRVGGQNGAWMRMPNYRRLGDVTTSTTCTALHCRRQRRACIASWSSVASACPRRLHRPRLPRHCRPNARRLGRAD